MSSIGEQLPKLKDGYYWAFGVMGTYGASLGAGPYWVSCLRFASWREKIRQLDFRKGREVFRAQGHKISVIKTATEHAEALGLTVSDDV
jgi:hypothetical protein